MYNWRFVHSFQKKMLLWCCGLCQAQAVAFGDFCMDAEIGHTVRRP